MMGLKERNFQSHTALCLDDLVPANNFYRQLQTKLDLSFVRELVYDYYAPFGRPSIDPVVFFKLQLIMFFEAIRSERQLVATVAMRLDHRWYLGYDLTETLPDHSSLSRIRDRYGVAIFQRFFEHIVEQCIKVGLVWGEELFFDGTIVLANADYDQQVPRFYWQHVQDHLAARGLTEEKVARPTPDLIAKYDGRRSVVKPNSYKKKSNDWVCATDPNATPIGIGQAKLGYRLQYAVDGGRSRIVLACLVTPSRIQDQTPLLDLTRRTQFRWSLKLKRVIADMRYGTGENLAGLETQGLRAFIPPFRDASERRTQLIPKSKFSYDATRDCYTCPQGQVLVRRAAPTPELRHYRASGKACRRCPIQSQCTTNKRARTITHSIYKTYEDRVSEYQTWPAYQKAMRKRQVWIEPKFGEVKQWHNGRSFRLRGILKVNCEALMRAAGQNIKQILKGRRVYRPSNPPVLFLNGIKFCFFLCSFVAAPSNGFSRH